MPLPHRRAVPIGLAALATASVALLLGGCAQASAGTASPAPTTVAPSPVGELPTDPDEAHLCGQISAYAGIVYRSNWQHEQGLIDDVAYQSRVDAVVDGLKYLVAGGTSVSAEAKLLAGAAEPGGVGYDNVEFQSAMEQMGAACDEAGSLIAVSALPGQGG